MSCWVTAVLLSWLGICITYQIFLISVSDTSDPSSIKAAAATITECLHGAGLNLLFNNAGIVKASSLESETPENMSEVYNTNVIGPMVMGQVGDLSFWLGLT